MDPNPTPTLSLGDEPTEVARVVEREALREECG